MGKHPPNNQGIALITTLVIVALVVAVVVEFNRIAVADIEVSKNFSDEKKITYLAISGINGIKDLLMLEGLYSKGDMLFEEWANSKSYFESATAMLEEGRLEGVIYDETSKINVNSLVNEKGAFDATQKKIWERLLKQQRFGLTSDQVNIIIHGIKDWIDLDDEVSEIFGAEDSLYRASGYRCKNALLDTLEEMLLINGITREIFYGDSRAEGIQSYFTVFGEPKININTASLPILMALSDEMTEDIAEKFDEFRRDEANRWALANQKWYQRVWPYATPLPEAALTVSSSTFSVFLKATLRDTVKEVRAVISRPLDSPATVSYWQEM